ncbi:hypothetical protein DPMN_133615 [Dreissena polymorpha]|uniref:Uncharacterized protein n=1 Tax=Dreissena polymorpha TaxID=45954 RepID=A0A9D4FUL5_DREPO|nr:hypothetical protein DPMN_133615 [Dreissena polymorpha]
MCGCPENIDALKGDMSATSVVCNADQTITCNEGKNVVLLRCDLERKKRGNPDLHQSTSTNFYSQIREKSEVRMAMA